jgi:fructokinase
MGQATPVWGGIEAGGTKFVLAVARSPTEILARTVIPTGTPDQTFAAIETFFDQQRARFGPLSGLGIGTFGPVDIRRDSATYGTLLRTPKPGWQGASFPTRLAPLAVPLTVDTDVNAACLAEHRLGAGRDARTLAYVTVGTGIGVGIVRDGIPLSGFGHYEMGHVRVPRDRTVDPFGGVCPFHGDCLEGLAAGPAILARWGGDLGRQSGNPAALDLEAHYLGHLAATIVLTHMPDRIVLGGGVMKTPGLIEAIRAKTAALLGGYVADGPVTDMSDYIRPPGLGDEAGLVGALCLAVSAPARP